ncbi:hypothetical protein BSKO_05010 [Bryopsis sp. KO-2023]|nr:hypothetical protein BSKO_05010 [Bryopsis sp. KO-2023]
MDAARRNNSSRATFKHEDLDNPFASGGFRWVAKGVYTRGQRKGEACVCKWFKSGSVFSRAFFSEDIKAVAKAIEIVQDWNDEGLVNKTVQVNEAEVWTFLETGEQCLVEPFIKNYQKFNSNSGWCDRSTPWPRVMQALSHYSYYLSDGELLLCDLQGGCYRNGIVLTDPVIMSRGRHFGVTDLGAKGIANFFAKHKCNEYCRSYWAKPSNARSHFRAVPGTTMRPNNVPTRHSRGLMTLQE